MEEISLITFLRRSPSLMKVVFPCESDKVILAKEVKDLMTLKTEWTVSRMKELHGFVNSTLMNCKQE